MPADGGMSGTPYHTNFFIETKFTKKHSAQCTVIFKTEKPISKEDGFVVPSMQPLPIKEMMDVFKTMNEHPSINIKIT